MFLEPVEHTYVKKIVDKLKPKTSCGHDEISTKIMKLSIDTIIHPITHIINLSFSKGIFPKQLKIAKVIPLFKSGAKDQQKNYRPISLLPAFSKIFEKIMFNKIMSYLDSKSILYPHQYGFRPKHTTIHPLIHLLNKCAEANSNTPKQLTMSIFCDLSKAFDVINHKILIHKLEFYGIRGIVKDWLINYLSHRSQYVQVEDVSSNLLQIECGVPQGSILGPLLYLIYVNDIHVSTQGLLLSYADDTSLIITDHDKINLFHKANTEISNLYDWFCANKLLLNANKTNFIVFRAPQNQCDFSDSNVFIDGIPLTQVGTHFEEKSTKFLGMLLDESLTWRYHINYINNKIARSLFMIKQVKKTLPSENLRMLYFAMIHPYLSYGLTAWGNAAPNIINSTIVLQKKAIRTINSKAYNSHTEPLFKNMNILKLVDQFKYDVLLFMFDCNANKLPRSFDNTFAHNCDNQTHYLTRQSNLFHIVRCHTNFARKLPLVTFPQLWNQYNQANDKYNSRSSFKRAVKSNMLSKYATIIKCQVPACPECGH